MTIYLNITSKRQKKSKTKKIIIIIAIVFVLLSTAILAAIPFMVMPMFLGQRFKQEQFSSIDFGIQSERITLTTDDSLSIAAWHTRSENSKGTVIILSGIQNPSVTAFFGYSKMLSDNNWDSLLIEMRARSESEGDEIGLGMTEWLDVKAGVDYLTSDTNAKDLPIVTMGTSMGGGTVIIAAGELPEIDAVISISAFSSWPDMFVDNMTMFGMPKAIGILDIPFINMYMGFHFGFDALKYSPINGIEKLGNRPILMMHSTGDTQVPYSEFEKLLNKANKNNINVTTFIREGDEHFVCYEQYFDKPNQDIEFSQTILSFLSANFP
ncbi:prolyl oligopeptidase family serine peptidase [Tissierella carlieri]|uniref:alpha/beta hydrolase n=1 Tax=Tissierella carlieri TaxID=689904 RepID=UPI001C1252B8|nr:prolyl oligopeptidase family serine peptidase [Tissierella carlieri]MBU5310905.1 prolyl oligopeptidase family serine peptidase [Tissierella carlieri]